MNGKRFKTSIAILVLLCSIGFISATHAQIKTTQGDWDDPNSPFETIEMTVSPAALPEPIFTHRLTLLPHQTVAGNAAPVYMNSFADRGLVQLWNTAYKQFGDELHEEDMPLDKLRAASKIFDKYVQNHIVKASLRRDCDWGYGVEDLKGLSVLDLALNTAQEARSISRVLRLQAELAIRESRFDEAVDLMRMNYRLAENVGKTKLLVSNLVGIAIAGITNGNMTDFIAAPDSPNMYWALGELPKPFIDMRGAFRTECQSILRMFPILENVESEDHSPDEWARVVNKSVFELTQQSESDSYLLKFAPVAYGVLAYSEDKQQLIAEGMDKATIEGMPVAKVLLVRANRDYRRLADQVESLAYLPLPIAIKRSRQVEEALEIAQSSSRPGFGTVMATMTLPAAQQIIHARARTERNIDVLRVIEALRAHAAVHGKLPNTLEEIDLVEVPNNSATGKPFIYRLEGETAVLDLPRSDGPVYSPRYKITLR